MKTKQTELIEQWGYHKEIIQTGDLIAQACKLLEESLEVVKDIQDGKLEEAKMEVGDCRVVLTILAHMLGSDLEECTQMAYNKIQNRKGKLVGNVFVKESDL